GPVGHRGQPALSLDDQACAGVMRLDAGDQRADVAQLFHVVRSWLRCGAAMVVQAAGPEAIGGAVAARRGRGGLASAAAIERRPSRRQRAAVAAGTRQIRAAPVSADVDRLDVDELVDAEFAELAP